MSRRLILNLVVRCSSKTRRLHRRATSIQRERPFLFNPRTSMADRTSLVLTRGMTPFLVRRRCERRREVACMMAVCIKRLVTDTARVWKSLKAVRIMEGSGTWSEAYADQWGHGEGR